MEDMKNVNFLVMLSQPLGKVRRGGGGGDLPTSVAEPAGANYCCCSRGSG